MKVRTKILGGFMIVALVGAVIGAMALVTSNMLTATAAEMYQLQLEGSGISNVLNAHYLWRQNITEAALNGTEFTGSLNPDTCALGQWRNSEDAQRMSDSQLLEMLGELDAPHAAIHTQAQTVVDAIAAGDLESAKQHLNETILPTTQEVISVFTDMQARYTLLVEEKEAETTRIQTLVFIVNAALIALAIVSGVLFAFLIAGMVSKPLAPLTSFMDRAGHTGNLELTGADKASLEKYALKTDELGLAIKGAAAFVGRIQQVSKVLGVIAENDLTADIAPLSDQDTLGISLQKMTGSLGRTFSEFSAASAQVTSASTQVADGSQTLAQGAAQQAASIGELSSAVSEMAEKTRVNAEIAGKSAKLSETILASAEKGSRQMNEMTAAVKDINEAGQSIKMVIKTIDDIAFQTNILALNAAVEAARAGEHGKGFAVVADEVRNLAAKSAEAAKDTESLIANSIAKAELGGRIAAETAASLAGIVSGIGESSQLIADIARLSEEQSTGIGEINTGIDQVAQVVQHNSATAQESAAAADEMSSQSDLLREMIAQYKLKGEYSDAG